MQEVKWGEFKIGDLFDSSNGDFDIQKIHINDKGTYVVTAGLLNNGILGKTDIEAQIFSSKTFTIDMFGNTFYRQFDYKMVTHARVFSLKPKFIISDKIGLFISSAFNRFSKMFGFDNMCTWHKIKSEYIKLPIKNNEIDFEFIDSFVAELEAQRVAELEAYLQVTGLKDYELTEEEENALNNLTNKKIVWGKISYKDVFNNIQQGRRLKKDDQLIGNIPFVMAGITNTGVVGYISNPVASFPKNSITIDIFGNTFYRNYPFGAGDDTGVYWSSNTQYTENQMLFFSTSMNKSIKGLFSYGNKLRSSQSLNLKMNIPILNNNIDFDYMDTLISAIKKLVIKDVVKYADNKISATRKVINKE